MRTRQNHSFITTQSWVNHVEVGMAAALFLCLPLKSPAIMGRAHGVPAATLTSVSLGGEAEQPPSQPSALLGFGPCGSCFQSQWLRSASLVRCSDKALITTDEYMRQQQSCNWIAGALMFESLAWAFIVNLLNSNARISFLSYLFFLIKSLLVAVWYAETSGVEDVAYFQAAENVLNLSSTGSL